MLLHPLNVRKHFHVNIGSMGRRPDQTKVFKTREDANTYARKAAKKEAAVSGEDFKGGSFGNTSLAFYAIGKRYVEVVRCELPGKEHRE